VTRQAGLVLGRRQVVIESTGHFTDATKAKAHLHGTVKKSSSPLPRPTRI